MRSGDPAACRAGEQEGVDGMQGLKRGLSQIVMGGQSLIADGVQLCREIGYEGFEILMTDGGELTPEAGEGEYRVGGGKGGGAGLGFPSPRGRATPGTHPARGDP